MGFFLGFRVLLLEELVFWARAVHGSAVTIERSWVAIGLGVAESMDIGVDLP